MPYQSLYHFPAQPGRSATFHSDYATVRRAYEPGIHVHPLIHQVIDPSDKLVHSILFCHNAIVLSFYIFTAICWWR